MKFFVYFLLILISVLSVNANIHIFREEIGINDNLQAELEFKNLIEDIKVDNIKIITSSNESTNIGVILNKIDKNRYFLYSKIPEIGKYQLSINKIKSLENNILKEESFEKEFSVIKKDSLLEINPTFITLKQGEKNFFKIDIENKGSQVENITIKDLSNSTKINPSELNLNPNQLDSTFLSINKLENERLDLKINDYVLPIYILNENKPDLNFFIKDNEINYITNFESEVSLGGYAEGTIFIENKNKDNLTNLSLSLEGSIRDLVKLGYEKIDNLESNKFIELKLVMNKIFNSGTYNGNLVIANKEIIVKLPILIKVKEITQIETQKNISKQPENIEVDTKIKNTIEKEVKIEKKLDKKSLSYIIISIIVLLFTVVYIILYLKTGKSKE